MREGDDSGASFVSAITNPLHSVKTEMFLNNFVQDYREGQLRHEAVSLIF